ncbi:MAG: hypothetical protein KDD50_10740 [Bdellovibrionales bacterium]|nr:hypothetical protein [Bdellovibrionales bacterium]
MLKNYSFKTHINPNYQTIYELKPLFIELFNDWDEDWLMGTFERHQLVHLIMAKDMSRNIVGFKLGYGVSYKTFYSWLGGVSAGHRQKGVAGKMIEIQQSWAKESNFKKITTKSMNKFREMMILNLKSGFVINGTELDESGRVKVLFEKEI